MRRISLELGRACALRWRSRTTSSHRGGRRGRGGELNRNPIFVACSGALRRSVITQAGVEMIHVLVHDKQDPVGVIVVEGIKAGQELTGWVMEDDSTIQVKALNDVP